MVAARDVVATDSVSAIVSVYDCVAVRASASVTRIVIGKLPATVGVPERTPAELSESPVGNEPDATTHEYVPTPPAAARVCENAVPLMPSGSDAVVTDNAVPATAIDNDRVAERPPPSVTFTEKVAVTFEVDVGVPEITPVVGSRVKPAGGLPVGMDHANGANPPDARTVDE